LERCTSDPREQELLEIIRRKDLEIKLLREKIDLLVRKVFGSSSEMLDPKQLDLLSGSDDLGKEPAPTGIGVEKLETTFPCSEGKKVKAKRERLPEHLPVVEEVIDPLEVQESPQNWKQIGQEVSEQLDYQPGKFFRRRLVRRKYVSKTNKEQAPVIAPLPSLLQERCLAAPAMIAHVITAKYCDHLPLYRQQDILWRRHKIPLPRQTMMGWLGDDGGGSPPTHLSSHPRRGDERRVRAGG
jgi:transposase